MPRLDIGSIVALECCGAVRGASQERRVLREIVRQDALRRAQTRIRFLPAGGNFHFLTSMTHTQLRPSQYAKREDSSRKVEVRARFL